MRTGACLAGDGLVGIFDAAQYVKTESAILAEIFVDWHGVILNNVDAILLPLAFREKGVFAQPLNFRDGSKVA